jgi:hypothetical protein
MRFARYGCVRTLVRVFSHVPHIKVVMDFQQHRARPSSWSSSQKSQPLKTASSYNLVLFHSLYCKRHVFIQGCEREPGRRSSPTNTSAGTSRSLFVVRPADTDSSSRQIPDQVVYARCRTTLGKEATRLVVRSFGSIRGNPWVSCRRVWIAVSRDQVLLLLLCIRFCSAACRRQRPRETRILLRYC